MAGRGPAPKPADQRARRNATVAMTRLPKSGRKGRAPKWPLTIDISYDTAIALLKLEMKTTEYDIDWASTSRDRSAARRKLSRQKQQVAKLEVQKKAASALEKEIWLELWKMPQATQWELRGSYRDVALYCRLQAKGETGSLDEAKEARQWSDRLGMNDQAMARLRWEIYDDTEQAAAPPPRARRSSRKYGDLRVVG